MLHSATLLPYCPLPLLLAAAAVEEVVASAADTFVAAASVVGAEVALDILAAAGTLAVVDSDAAAVAHIRYQTSALPSVAVVASTAVEATPVMP